MWGAHDNSETREQRLENNPADPAHQQQRQDSRQDLNSAPRAAFQEGYRLVSTGSERALGVGVQLAQRRLRKQEVSSEP